jgi:predicted small integral membrane protein
MAIRYLKMILLICVSLQGLLYAIQNVANLDQAFASLAYVMSNQDHVAYPNSAFPAITSPLLIWIALGLVLIGEFGAGLLSAKGTWNLFVKRGASADEFNAAKTLGILGCGVAVVTWFGLFLVFGSAYFQMWQTAIGDGSFKGAFICMGSSAFVMLFLNMKD